MIIPAIQRLTPQALSQLRANEGVALTAQRTTAIVLSTLATLASFAFLPWQTALVASVAAVSVFLAWGFECCQARMVGVPVPGPTPMPVILQPIPWYRRIIHRIPFFRDDEVVAVRDPRPREPVGQGHQNPNRVRARDIPAVGVGVLPPHSDPYPIAVHFAPWLSQDFERELAHGEHNFRQPPQVHNQAQTGAPVTVVRNGITPQQPAGIPRQLVREPVGHR